jgi:hypothetical protein
MKASELRIGNLVDLGNRIAKISEIYHNACTVLDLEETQDTIEDYERTKPIPLTEEWLLKFGFEWSIQHQAHYLKGFDYVIDICKDYCRVIKHRRTGEVLINIKHVHQLQNLYFALTGEELILNI